MGPEVKVRLSAEGLQEVVKAFRTISTEGERAGRASAGGFNPLKSILGQVRTLLPAISAGLVAAAFTRQTRDALDYADAIQKAAQRTSTAASTYSVLANAATTADVPQEKLQQSLVRLARFLDDVKSGTLESVVTFKRLGLQWDELEGKDPGQIFVMLADRIAKAEDRTALATRVFGRSGADLLPLINDLAEKGFGALADEAERSGNRISDQTAQMAADINDAATRSQNAIRGVFTEFLGQIGPDTVTAFDRFTAAVDRNRSTWASWLATFAGGALSAVEQFFDRLRDPRFLAALAQGPTQFAFFKGIEKAAPIPAAPSNELVGPPLPPGYKRPGAAGGTGGSSAIDDPAQKARLRAMQAAADAELKIVQSRAKLEQSANQAAYDQGLVTLEQYTAKRRDVAVRALDAEIALLQRKQEQAAAAPANDAATKIANEQQVAVITAQIQTKQLERQQLLVDETAKERQEREQLAAQVLTFERELAPTQAARNQAELAALDEQLRAYDKLLAQAGVAEQSRARIVGAAGAAAKSRLEVDQLAAEVHAQLDDLNSQITAVDQARARGAVGGYQAEAQITELERQRLPLLQSLAAELERIAQASGDPAFLQQAQQINAAVGDVAVGADEAGRTIADLRDKTEGATEQGLGAFFGTALKGVNHLNDAWGDMKNSFVNSIRQMLEDAATKQLMKFLFGGAGGGGILGGLSGLFGLGSKDVGGYTGPAARNVATDIVHGQEFVVRAGVVAQPGVRAYLERLNAGGVAAAAGAMGAGGGTVNHVFAGALDMVMGEYLRNWLSRESFGR